MDQADRCRVLRPVAYYFGMIPIIGPPAIAFAYVFLNAKTQTPSPWFLNSAIPALWEAGELEGIDPVVLTAQSALETNWGRFGGAINQTWGNTAGIKHRWATGDGPEDHARFPVDGSVPRVGALAQAQHLRCYCGFEPRTAPIVDPRYEFIKTSDRVLFVEDLSKRWAPSADYGEKIAAIHRRLCGVGNR